MSQERWRDSFYMFRARRSRGVRQVCARQGEMEGWAVLVLVVQERWRRLCLCLRGRGRERGALGQGEKRDGVCLWWARIHRGLDLLVLKQETFLTRPFIIINKVLGNSALNKS